jgi:(p)ppGpp synthase/HD superfamily hydrolase
MIGKESLPQTDRVEEALQFAGKCHEGQFRKSGEEYISHCYNVYKILKEEWGIQDQDTLIAALLHDSVEDGKVSLDEIASLFGQNVAEIVDGVTKLKSDTDKQASQKVFDKSMLRPAVALVKLADRLHNMRTQEYMDSDKRIKKSEETFNTYIPLAESLGMWQVKRELEDLCYYWYDLDSYKKIEKSVKQDERSSQLFQANITSKIEDIFNQQNFPINQINIRNESYKFINEKLNNLRTNDLQAVNDIISLRIVVNSEEDIYKALSILDQSKAIKIDPYKCDRYLNENKQANGYQALQTTIISNKGLVEIAIVTKEMEEFNNWGIISLIRNGQKMSELTNYFLKPIFVHEDQVRFVSTQATIIDILRNTEKLNYAISANIDGKECPLSTIPPSSSTISINYGDKPVNLNDYKDYCLPQTRLSLDKLQQQVEEEKIINQGKSKIKKNLSSRGLLSLAHLEKIDSLKYQQLINQLGPNKKNLYYSLGNGFMKEEKFNKVLDELMITKSDLNVTSIEIFGEDKPHILNEILSHIPTNIVINESFIDNNNMFTTCLVIKDLNIQQEEKIRKYFTPRFTSVLVV